jgi:hypothetical protein
MQSTKPRRDVLSSDHHTLVDTTSEGRPNAELSSDCSNNFQREQCTSIVELSANKAQGRQIDGASLAEARLSQNLPYKRALWSFLLGYLSERAPQGKPFSRSEYIACSKSAAQCGSPAAKLGREDSEPHPRLSPYVRLTSTYPGQRLA